MSKIKSETIATKHKKTKNFLIVLFAIGIVVVLVGSFLSVYSENQKAFSKKKKEAEKPVQTEAVDKREIKESWALSVERRLKENQALMAKGIKASEKSFREDAQRREEKMNQKFDEIKKLIQLSQSTIEEKIKRIDSRITDVERNTKESITKLSMEMKKIKNKQVYSASSTDNKVRKKFLPPLPESMKKNNTGGFVGKSNSASKANTTASNGKIPLPPLLNGANNKKIKDVKPKVEIDENKLTFYVEDEINENVTKAFPLDQNETEEQAPQVAQYELGLGFFSAVTLTGAYAPIFGEATDQTSIPVLLEIEGDMIVANGFTESVDQCFALGGAIGNPSSNTVDIRLSVMECILADGKHKIRGEIKGWVIGENGKPGLTGTLIHKSGQYISRFILAGLLESLSSAFVTAATPDNANATTTSVITGGAAQGAAQGTQNAFTRLADFYIKLAEKTLPMIEAKAGRHISVLVQGGTLYEVTEFNPIDIDGLIRDYEEKSKRN